MRFSAIDQNITNTSCTTKHPGGWWFADCLDSNLNGKFETASNQNETIFWRTINEKIAKTEMKIQPYDNKGKFLLKVWITLSVLFLSALGPVVQSWVSLTLG